MSAIDAYLAALKRTLWMSSATRQSTIAEVHAHLTSLEEEQGRSFDSIAEISQRFGTPLDIGSDLSRSIPWFRSRAPWWLFAIGPCSVALAMVVGYMYHPRDVDPLITSTSWAVAADCASHLYSIVITLLIIVLALRQGVRPLLIIAAIFLPEIVVLALMDYTLIFKLHVLRRGSVVPLLLGSGGFLTTKVVGVLALIALAHVRRTTPLYPAVVTWGLVLAGCQAIDVALQIGLSGSVSLRHLPVDCIGMAVSASAALFLADSCCSVALLQTKSASGAASLALRAAGREV